MRNLFLFLFALAVIWWVRRTLRPASKPHHPPPSASGVEQIRACAHCGIHIPESEGVWDGKNASPLFFCSRAHQQLGQRHPED